MEKFASLRRWISIGLGGHTSMEELVQHPLRRPLLSSCWRILCCLILINQQIQPFTITLAMPDTLYLERNDAIARSPDFEATRLTKP